MRCDTGIERVRGSRQAKVTGGRTWSRPVMGKASPCRAGRASLTHGGDPSLLVLTSKNFSRSFFIDVFPRADGHDFDVACSEPIDDSSSPTRKLQYPSSSSLSAFPQV